MSYRNYFKQDAERYEKITQSEYIRLVYEIQRDVLDAYFEDIDTKSSSVLDFACGSGRWTQYLESKFGESVGVDVSREMIRYARKKCSGTEFIVADITKEADIRDEFDVITAFRFYKNAEDELREAATEELADLLADDGQFIFDLHLNTYSFNGISANILERTGLEKLFDFGPYTLKTVSLPEIERLLERHGLEVVDYYGVGFLPGRKDQLFLPRRLLYPLEKELTSRKRFRFFSYTLVVVAEKKEVTNGTSR